MATTASGTARSLPTPATVVAVEKVEVAGGSTTTETGRGEAAAADAETAAGAPPVLSY
jgi:hypothetical protein